MRVGKPFRAVKDELPRNLVRITRVARAQLRQTTTLATKTPIKVTEQVMRNRKIVTQADNNRLHVVPPSFSVVTASGGNVA